MTRLLLASTVLAGVALAAVPAHAEGGFAPHRAVYDLTLSPKAQTKEGTALSGRMVYEFNGSACDGWTTQFRYVTVMSGSEGAQDRVTDLRVTSYEAPKGDSFDFVNQSYMNQRIDNNTKGTAARNEGGGVTVKLDQPEKRSYKITEPALFPTAHMSKVVTTARDGGTILEAPIFDGSGDGDKVYRSTTVIGRERTGPDDTAAEPAAAVPDLASARRWPVSISYFDGEREGGEDTPDYTMSFILYENGVSRRLTMDYGDLVIDGRLSSIEMLPKRDCK